MKFNILALDCATKTGWATRIAGRIESGVQDFTKKYGESNGILFMKFNRWLEEMYLIGEKIGKEQKLDSFDLIVYEQTHHRGRAATELCIGLTTRVQEFATKHNIEYMPVHSGTLKKRTLGAGSGRANKQKMMDWFEKERGRPPIDDNEADGYALLCFAMSEIGEKRNDC